MQCLGCNYRSNTYEDLMSLSLDIPRNNSYKGSNSSSDITFESCLNYFCRSEDLKGDNKYMCSNCKKKCDAKKRFSIEKTPGILIVHFKRFTNMGTKI